MRRPNPLRERPRIAGGNPADQCAVAIGRCVAVRGGTPAARGSGSDSDGHCVRARGGSLQFVGGGRDLSRKGPPGRTGVADSGEFTRSGDAAVTRSAAEFFAAGGGVLVRCVNAGCGCIAPASPEGYREYLIEEFDGPLTGTSANLSGSPACTGAEQVFTQLGDRLQLILDAGETKSASPSTIVELHGDTWKVLREGAISSKEIEVALQ
ncbi:MAG: hypothetical protein DMG34_17350 [Acidobacteria bacterium]|nr:MAG: hypothetical protein DMG34_17350 [Acidobacteriota bacterium]